MILRDDLCKNLGILLGNLREDFAIKGDVLLFEVVDEDAVGCSAFTRGGVDAEGLQGAVVALLQFTVAVGVDTRLGGGDFGERDLRLAAPHHALGSG